MSITQSRLPDSENGTRGGRATDSNLQKIEVEIEGLHKVLDTLIDCTMCLSDIIEGRETAPDTEIRQRVKDIEDRLDSLEEGWIDLEYLIHREIWEPRNRRKARQ